MKEEALSPEMQDWDYENAEKRVPTRKPRAIVSVAFPREDFELVEEAAERAGMKLSEFIREAALGRARPQPPAKVLVTYSGVSAGSLQGLAVFSPDVSSAPSMGTSRNYFVQDPPEPVTSS